MPTISHIQRVHMRLQLTLLKLNCATTLCEVLLGCLDHFGQVQDRHRGGGVLPGQLPSQSTRAACQK